MDFMNFLIVVFSVYLINNLITTYIRFSFLLYIFLVNTFVSLIMLMTTVNVLRI